MARGFVTFTIGHLSPDFDWDANAQLASEKALSVMWAVCPSDEPNAVAHTGWTTKAKRSTDSTSWGQSFCIPINFENRTVPYDVTFQLAARHKLSDNTVYGKGTLSLRHVYFVDMVSMVPIFPAQGAKRHTLGSVCVHAWFMPSLAVVDANVMSPQKSMPKLRGGGSRLRKAKRTSGAAAAQDSEEHSDTDASHDANQLFHVTKAVVDLVVEEYVFDLPDAEDTIIYATFGNISTIQAASLPKIVEKITSMNAALSWCTMILVTLRSFADPLAVYELVEARYKGPPPPSDASGVTSLQRAIWDDNQAQIRNSVGMLIKRWIARTSDFSDCEALVARIHESLEQRVFDEQPKLVASLKADLERLKAQKESAVEGSCEAWSPRMSRRVSSMYTATVLEMPADVIAQQLTLIEWQLLKSVCPHELFKQRWNKAAAECPHTVAMVQWFNRVSQWVATEIIKMETPKERAVIISKYIQVANHAFTLRNMSAVMQVLSALHDAPIMRLRRSWDLIPDSLLSRLSDLSDIMQPNPNFKAYRKLMTTITPPYVPYMGVHLIDLTIIDDANETFTSHGLINVRKAKMLYDVVTMLQRGTSMRYRDFSPDPSVQAMLTQAPVFDEVEIFRMSKLREPDTERRRSDLQKSTMLGSSRSDMLLSMGGRGESMAVDSKQTHKGFGKENKSKALARVAKSMLRRTNMTVDTKGLTDRDWHALLAGARDLLCNKDEVILPEGARNRCMYRISRGAVRVVKGHGTGSELHLARMEVGRVFGEMSVLLSDNEASATVIADEPDTLLSEMPIAYLHSLFENDDELSRRFYLSQAQKLSNILITLNPKSDVSNEQLEEQSNKTEAITLMGPQSRRDSEAHRRGSASDGNGGDGGGGGGAGGGAIGGSDEHNAAVLLGLPAEEVAVKTWRVLMRKKRGRLIVTQSYVGFHAHLFLSTVRKTYPLNNVIKLKTRRNVLEMRVRKRGRSNVRGSKLGDERACFTLDTPELAMEAKTVITGIWTTAKARFARNVGDEALNAALRLSMPGTLPLLDPKAPTFADRRPSMQQSRLWRRESSPATQAGAQAAEEDEGASADAASDDSDQETPAVAASSSMEAQPSADDAGGDGANEPSLDQLELRFDPSNGHVELTFCGIQFTLKSSMSSAVLAQLPTLAMVEGVWTRTGDVEVSGGEDRTQSMTSEDWDLILDGAKRVTYSDGEVIVRQGQPFQSLYQVEGGGADIIVTTPDGQRVHVTTLGEGELFGEISFLNNTLERAYRPGASVVAHGETTVSVIQGYFVSMLMDITSGLAGRFFKFLANILAERVRAQLKRNQEAARVKSSQATVSVVEDKKQREGDAGTPEVIPTNPSAQAVSSDAVGDATATQ